MFVLLRVLAIGEAVVIGIDQFQPKAVRLFGSFHVHAHGGAGTYKIPVAIDVVDAVDWRPILIDPKSAGREICSLSRIGAVPFGGQGPRSEGGVLWRGCFLCPSSVFLLLC